MTCGAPAPENIGRCILERGHHGDHWNSGGWWPRYTPKKQGVDPLHGTAEDVAALYRAMAGACQDVAAERRDEEQRAAARSGSEGRGW